MKSETIAAIATYTGRGGIGIVRLSGPESKIIAQKLFRSQSSNPEVQTHQAVYGEIVDPKTGENLDHGYGVFFAKPNSYTGEDVFEFQIHGSPVLLRRTVELCLESGARAAEAGEFTKRAFLNGKLDLVQAEAVAELIAAESMEEAKSAHRRLEGRISHKMRELRKMTIELLAECEAGIDFPEEELPLSDQPELLRKTQQIQSVTDFLIRSFSMNRRLNEGFWIALMGRPNVGKSSLFNALLVEDRAIVTEIPGTTRDILKEDLEIAGRKIRLADTAGLRSSTDDPVEKIGMERTGQAARNADLILYVCDVTQGWTKEDESLLEQQDGPEKWIVWNKVDLHGSGARPGLNAKREYYVSALRGDGLSELKGELEKHLTTNMASTGDGGIGNERQKDELEGFRRDFERAVQGWERAESPDLVAQDLRKAYQGISRILGESEDMEAVLDEIFSRFCIGK